MKKNAQRRVASASIGWVRPGSTQAKLSAKKLTDQATA